MDSKLNVLTWNIHGSYLYYLSQANCEFFVPVGKNSFISIKDGERGYSRLQSDFAWGNNMHQIPVEKIKDLKLDLILFQSNFPLHKIFLEDQYSILSTAQQGLPKIYLEHDPPREHPTDTKHIVDNQDMLLVHVTNFNNLMWDGNRTPTKVIEHGVKIPVGVSYRGDIPKGLVSINNLLVRGRRLGFDIYEALKKKVPLDLAGINSEKLGGLGSINMNMLMEKISHYRFFFSPIRYSSLGLSVCEAMMIGLPVLGLATTELVTVVRNGFNGFIETDPLKLIPHMKKLLNDYNYAWEISKNAREYAQKRFGIKRFTKDWEETFKIHAATTRQRSS